MSGAQRRRDKQDKEHNASAETMIKISGLHGQKTHHQDHCRINEIAHDTD